MSTPITTVPPAGRADDLVSPTGEVLVEAPPLTDEPPAETPPAADTTKDDMPPSTTSSTAYAEGTLVHYRHPDPITGQELSGFGIVLRASQDGSSAAIAPVSVDLPLEVEPDGLAAVELPAVAQA